MTGPDKVLRSNAAGHESGSRPARLLLAGAFVIMAAIAASLVLGLGPAGAHSVVVGSDPAENSVLESFPDRISVEFNEQPGPAFAVLDAIGPDGTSLAAADPVVQGTSVSVAVDPPRIAGAYSLVYRVTSADGHAIEGQIPFTVSDAAVVTDTDAAAAPTEQSTRAEPTVDAQADTDDSGLPVWPLVVGAVVVAAGGLFAVLRSRRHTGVT